MRLLVLRMPIVMGWPCKTAAGLVCDVDVPSGYSATYTACCVPTCSISVLICIFFGSSIIARFTLKSPRRAKKLQRNTYTPPEQHAGQ